MESAPTLGMIVDKHKSVEMNRREQATRPTIWFITDWLGLCWYAGRQGCRPLRCGYTKLIDVLANYCLDKSHQIGGRIWNPPLRYEWLRINKFDRNESAEASHPPYDLIYYRLIGFVLICGTPKMSSPTIAKCNHFVREDIILPLKLASDCLRADVEYIPTMW